MANKKITDLQLRANVTDDLNFPSDDSIQSYRVTGLQIKDYVLPSSAVTVSKLATDAVETIKIKDGNVTLAKLASSLVDFLMPIGTLITSARAATNVPSGYLYCNGQAVSRVTYAALFAEIGTFHGTGNGSTTFNVPDLRGYFVRGQDNGRTIDPERASRVAISGGNSGDNVGSTQGWSVTDHNHSAPVGGYGVGVGPAFGSGPGGGTLNTYGSGTAGVNGKTETRPVNVYMNYFIKF